VMTEARLSQLKVARERFSSLRKQLNESKPPLKDKPKKMTKLELQIENLKLKNNISNDKDVLQHETVSVSETIDLHKTIRAKPEIKNAKTTTYVQEIEPLHEPTQEPEPKQEPKLEILKQNSIQKIGKFYYI
jgi:hypothetical protein